MSIGIAGARIAKRRSVVSRAISGLDIKNKEFVCIVLYTIGLFGLEFEALGLLRYSMYAIPPVFIFLSFFSHNRSMSRRDNLYVCVLVYVAIVALSLVAGEGPNETAFRDISIIAGYLLIYAEGWIPQRRHIDFLLVASTVLFAIKLIASGKSFGINLLVSASINETYDDFESFLGIVYLFYCIRYERNWRMAAALALFILGGKRIALGAFAAGAAFIFVASRALAGRQRATRLAFLCLLAMICALGANFVRIVEYAFDTLPQLASYEMEEFMAGRFTLGSAIIRMYEAKNFFASTFGSGPSTADAIIVAMQNNITLAHDDWLKILYDYGYVGSIVFVYIYYRIFRYDIWTMGLALANAIIMVTDNVLIYMFYQIPLLIIYSSFKSFGDVPACTVFQLMQENTRRIRIG